MVPVAIELLVLRLKWWQVIFTEVAHHSQVITAVFGHSPALNEGPAFRQDGRLTDEANPGAVKFLQDVLT